MIMNNVTRMMGMFPPILVVDEPVKDFKKLLVSLPTTTCPVVALAGTA